MAREKECYREILADLASKFPGKNLLCIKDVCNYTGRNYRTVKKRYVFKRDCTITLMDLARQLAI